MEQQKPWRFIIGTLIGLALLSFIAAGIFSLFIGDDIESSDANIAVIPVKGVILADDGYGLFSEDVAASTEIVKLVRSAARSKSIKGIILEINSPGGSPVASEEIARAVKEANKTTVAWIREVGASGGYWVASATDHIVASKLSITGSIGVQASYLEFAGFLEDHNVTYQRFVGGDYKDLGNPLRKLEEGERRILQAKIDKMRDYFIDAVAENRNLPKKEVQKMATGLFYLGSEAKELGLVDEIGGKQEAIDYLKNELNLTDVHLREFKVERSLFDVLGSFMNENFFQMGRGLGSSLREEEKLAIYT